MKIWIPIHRSFSSQAVIQGIWISEDFGIQELIEA